MDLHLLGTAGYHPNERRHTACLMIPECGVIFDAGTSFFRVRDLIQTEQLHVFMSHAHLDHCVGLSYFLDVVFEKNVSDIFVYGEAEKLAAIREHLFSDALFPVNPGFHWIEIGDAEIRIPRNGRVTPFPLQHPGGSIGFRVDWPEQSMAYVTDTTASLDADYVAHIRDVDVLIHECHFADGHESFAEKTGHSCLTPVAQVSRAANVGLTVLVHLNPMDATDSPLDLTGVAHIFENMLLGEDRMVVKIESSQQEPVVRSRRDEGV